MFSSSLFKFFISSSIMASFEFVVVLVISQKVHWLPAPSGFILCALEDLQALGIGWS